MSTAACAEQESGVVRRLLTPHDVQAVRGEMVSLLPRLRRFAYGLCGSVEDADDLVQAACEKALANLQRWQPGTRLDSWMFRIAQNLRIDAVRTRRHRSVHVQMDDEQAGSGAEPADEVDARRTLQATMRAMRKLPEHERVVLTCVCVDGMSYKQAAECLELPIGTVMSRLARARRRLYRLVHEPDAASADEE